MKALSIRQPWAWLIVNGYKPVENRSRRTRHRGPFYVHASQTFDKAGYEWVREKFPDIPMPQPEEFERGGIVGVDGISRCVVFTNATAMGAFSAPLRAWFTGPFGYLLENARPLPFRKVKGKLGFFKVEES